MKFDLTAAERALPSPPIDADGLRLHLPTIRRSRLAHFIQAYVRDRVPSAFESRPLLWEDARRQICFRILKTFDAVVHPGEVGLTGSANLGFSPVPAKWGKPFGEGSDIDLFIANKNLFELTKLDAGHFLETTDIRYSEQRKTVAHQLSKGFVSTWQIPANRAIYRTSTELRHFAWALVSTLKDEGIVCKNSYFRVYSGWQSLSTQLEVNFSSLQRQL